MKPLAILLLLLIPGSLLLAQSQALVWTQKTELRAAPNMRGELVKQLYQGDQVTRTATEPKGNSTYNLLEGRFTAPWYEVKTTTGETGYVWGGGISFFDAEHPDAKLHSLIALKWDGNAWEMGTVKSPQALNKRFTFTNKGKKAYTIQSAKPSCGCIKSNWSKETIQPGETGWVDLSFNSYGRAGHEVHKYVTVIWKEGGYNKVIRVNGVVE